MRLSGRIRPIVVGTGTEGWDELTRKLLRNAGVSSGNTCSLRRNESLHGDEISARDVKSSVDRGLKGNLVGQRR